MFKKKQSPVANVTVDTDVLKVCLSSVISSEMLISASGDAGRSMVLTVDCARALLESLTEALAKLQK